MPSDNSLNTGKGRSFQESAAKLLSTHIGVEFLLDAPVEIGDPPKGHRFDLAAPDLSYVGECKNYAWTEGGNVPSAKMGFVNEAVFYLSFLPAHTKRFVAMRRDVHPQRGESLAEYYVRTYRHLLGDAEVYEIDEHSQTVRLIR